MIAILAAAVGSFLLTPPDPSIAPTAAMVARTLDLTSFDNSTGPRRRAGARTPADYGFINADTIGSLAVLSPKDRNWELTVELISRSGDDVVICFGDNARDGGSYRVQQPLTLHHELNGLYRALPDRPQVPSCPAKS
jgi:hypothetical protein